MIMHCRKCPQKLMATKWLIWIRQQHVRSSALPSPSKAQEQSNSLAMLLQGMNAEGDSLHFCLQCGCTFCIVIIGFSHLVRYPFYHSTSHTVVNVPESWPAAFMYCWMPRVSSPCAWLNAAIRLCLALGVLCHKLCFGRNFGLSNLDEASQICTLLHAGKIEGIHVTQLKPLANNFTFYNFLQCLG